MVSKLRTAAVAVAFISGAAWLAAPARADNFPPIEGTVYSTISPATEGCPELNWQVRVGPHNSLAGMVAQDGMKDIWRVTGSFKDDRSFQLHGQELGGAQRTGDVNGYVRESDGSLIFTVGNISDPSTCNNKSVWVRWFRNGNAYDPNELRALLDAPDRGSFWRERSCDAASRVRYATSASSVFFKTKTNQFGDAKPRGEGEMLINLRSGAGQRPYPRQRTARSAPAALGGDHHNSSCLAGGTPAEW